MLYDPKWEVKIKPFTLPDFIAWLETQSPDMRYDFDNCQGQCLMGQYMAHHGRPWGETNEAGDSTYWQSCKEVFDCASSVPVLLQHPLTYGGALERARALASPLNH